MKTCNVCKIQKALDAFSKNRAMRDGLQGRCTDCAKKSWHEEGWSKHLQRKYGITAEDYDALLAKQDGRCAICRRTPAETGRRRNGAQRLAVDHNHETGEVRGLLCLDCNTALALFGDDADRLQTAIGYLQGHSRQNFAYLLETPTYETVSVMR